jgi:hypothetical protein
VRFVKALRQHLRPLAIAWLLSQAVSLAAIVGFDCCAAHRTPTPEAKAPQPAETVACPMHAAAAAGAGTPMSNQQNPVKCVMRGSCNGPMAALLAVLSNNALPSESIAPTPALVAVAAPPRSPETFVVHSESPDTPPPRV